LSVTIKKMIDDSPDTSYLGEYSNTKQSEFSIDRKHSLECSVNNKPVEAIKKLERVLEHAQTYFDVDGQTDYYKDGEEETRDCLESLIEDLACDCGERGDMDRNEFRFFNPSFNYVDKTGKPA